MCVSTNVCVGGGTGDMSHVCEYKRVCLVERKESMQLTKFRVHFTFQLYREDNNKTKLTHTHWHTIIITTDEGFVSWLGKTFSYCHRNTADTSLTHTHNLPIVTV